MKTLFYSLVLFLFSCGATQEKTAEKKSADEKQEQPETVIEKQEPESAFQTLSVDDFAKQMESSCTVLDVRTPEEVAEGVIPQAVVINFNDPDFGEKIKTLDVAQPVCVYCRSGGRSAKASEILVASGYTVYNLNGGITAWQEAGKPIESIKK